jgi:succinoglycan biosynthesis transport protein ExoP
VLYNNFLQRYTEAVQQFSVPGSRVITPAEPPLERSWPSAFLVIAAAMFGGGAVGFGHSLLRYTTDRTLRTCGDLQRATGFECLAEINLIKERHWSSLGSNTNDLQQAYCRESAAFSEVVSRVAVYLQAARIRSSGSTIGVAAVEEEGGGSSVAAHVARVLARSGQKTLLIDANWRTPVTSDSSSDSVQESKIFNKIVTVDLGGDFVDVLVIRGKSRITDLLASQAIGAALLRMQSEYTCIVVDFHALERTADVSANISLIDDLVVVANAQHTRSDTLQKALRSLHRDKISVILNKVKG